MSGHRSAGTCLSFSHCQTAPFDTPSSLARAALEPSISEALLIGFVSMIASIDYLDSKCKEILAPLHLRVQAMDGSNFTVEVINTPMIFNGHH